MTFQLFANASPPNSKEAFEPYISAFFRIHLASIPPPAWPCGEAMRCSGDNIGFGSWRPGFEFWPLHYFSGFEVSGKSHTFQNLICETRVIISAFPATFLGFCECWKSKYFFFKIFNRSSTHVGTLIFIVKVNRVCVCVQVCVHTYTYTNTMLRRNF